MREGKIGHADSCRLCLESELSLGIHETEGLVLLFNTTEDVLSYCRDNGIRMIDFKLTDLVGRWHHLSIPVTRFAKNIFEEGIGFDGSSYGFLSVEQSDMAFIPDLGTAFYGLFLRAAHLKHDLRYLYRAARR